MEGGALIRNINTDKNHSLDSKSLEIKDNAPNLLLKDYSINLNDSLTIKKISENISLDATSDQNKEEAAGLINNLHKEVNLEEGVLNIDKETTQKYSDHTKGLQKHQKFFKQGMDLVQEFQNRQSGKRATRVAKSPKERKRILLLNKQMRSAIKAFYEAFDKLSTEEKNLWIRLNQVSGNSEKSKSSFSHPYKLQEVLVGLRRIGWENDKVELVSRSLNRKKFQPNLDNWYGWGSWEASPWKYFFDSSADWKNKISDVEKAKKALNSYLQRKRGCVFSIVLGQWGVNQCYSEKSKFEEQLAASEEAISLHIAKWMMKQMNLLN